MPGCPGLIRDILLNVFLAIAVDNLADAENMAKIDEETTRRKREAKERKGLGGFSEDSWIFLHSAIKGRLFFNQRFPFIFHKFLRIINVGWSVGWSVGRSVGWLK